MKTIIKVENLSKSYRLGEAASAFDLSRLVMSKLGRREARNAAPPGSILALNNVNLEVGVGDVLGLIGSNGSGKSTLLKILSRITEPTTGRVELYGTVGSLLEVGTGFHPELTGRENVYLNGAVLGMRKADVARKFDEIVSFSEIEKFIDTPVKFYSSGMYIRLAFSVAIHLEPDILIVDEVLSVGDMAFQQKCLQKMSQMTQRLRAIILVSHSMTSVRAICSRAVLLSQGQIKADGPPHDVISAYEKSMLERIEINRQEHEAAEGMGKIIIKAIRLNDANGQERPVFATGEKVSVMIEYEAVERLDDVIVYAAIRRLDDFICIATSTKLENMQLPPLEGSGCLQIEIPELMVLPGDYVMDVIFYDHNITHRAYFYGRKRVEFRVDSNLTGLDDFYGVFYQKQTWKLVDQTENNGRGAPVKAWRE